jgi:hypothetical protein
VKEEVNRGTDKMEDFHDDGNGEDEVGADQ